MFVISLTTKYHSNNSGTYLCYILKIILYMRQSVFVENVNNYVELQWVCKKYGNCYTYFSTYSWPEIKKTLYKYSHNHCYRFGDPITIPSTSLEPNKGT